ncbi:MAG: CoA ester lyase [Candidatus Alcyoniella australis]|nr:CoA ester lyase [Candidatus Alcyoniella australis]
MDDQTKFQFDGRITQRAAERNALLLATDDARRIELEPRYMAQTAHLTCPATVWKYVEGAVQRSRANLVMLDLEDSIPEGDHRALAQGRSNVIRALNELDWGPRLRFFRPRGMRLDPGFEDLAIVVAAAGRNLEGLVYPKIEGPDELRSLEQCLDELEQTHGLEPGRIKVEVLIESVQACQRAHEIADVGRRLRGLIFGAFDYWADLGMPAEEYRPDHPLVNAARVRIVEAAAGIGVPAIAEMTLDYPTSDKTEQQRTQALEQLRRDCELARGLGFSGKWTGIPAQVDVVLEAFAPDQAAIERALHEALEYRRANQSGRGATMINGRMADRATDRINRRLLRVALALGRLDPQQVRELGIDD